MKIDNLFTYEINKRAEALNCGPDSRSARLAQAAFELLSNENFTNNPVNFINAPQFKLSFYHKEVITAVYGISFRNIIR